MLSKFKGNYRPRMMKFASSDLSVNIVKVNPCILAKKHFGRALTNGMIDVIDTRAAWLKTRNVPEQNLTSSSKNLNFCLKKFTKVERNFETVQIKKKEGFEWYPVVPKFQNGSSGLMNRRRISLTQVRCIHQQNNDYSSPNQKDGTKIPPGDETSSKGQLKSVGDIPGPLSLPWAGTSWMYWRLGPYHRHTFHKADEDLYKKYGHIYREQRGGATLVSIHRAQDIERVFRQEGPRPLRVVNEALVYRRRKQPHVYPTVGLAEAVGEEWYHLRQMVAPSLLKPSEASNLWAHVDLASEALLEALLVLCNGQRARVPDLGHWMVRYGAEAIWRTTLGRELGALRADPPPEASQLSTLALAGFRLMAEIRLGSGRWKFWPQASPKYRQFARMDEAVYRLVTKSITEARAAITSRLLRTPSCHQMHVEDASPSTGYMPAVWPSGDAGVEEVPCILGKFYEVPGLDQRDANTVIIDFFSAGVTTTASSLVMLLHRLGQEPRVVQRLQHELDQVLPAGPGSSFNQETLDALPYLKAVVMEGFRLTPIIPSLIRILPEEIVIAGYRIPAYTPLIAKTRAACLDEANFSCPKEFLPERWLPDRYLEGRPEMALRAEAKRNQFLVKPFGFGARMCVGKRLAEYETYAALAKIVKSFDLKSEGAITLGNFLFLAPLHPVALTLTPRL